MKITSCVSLIAGLVLFATVASAAEEIRTITGEAMCAKCELKLQAKCQTVIRVKEGDKTVLYYVAGNAVGSAFHSTVCDAPAEVTATGTVAIVDGKQVLVPSTIKLIK